MAHRHYELRFRTHDHMIERAKHIEAEIYYLTPEEGGRHRPIFSGYRGQFYYDGHDWDAEQSFESEPVHPGQIVKTFLWFISPDNHRGRLWPGKEFEIREGARVVGRGKVIRLLE